MIFCIKSLYVCVHRAAVLTNVGDEMPWVIPMTRLLYIQGRNLVDRIWSTTAMHFTVPYMRNVMHSIGDKYGALYETNLLTGEREREKESKRERRVKRERQRGGRRDARQKGI